MNEWAPQKERGGSGGTAVTHLYESLGGETGGRSANKDNHLKHAMELARNLAYELAMKG